MNLIETILALLVAVAAVAWLAARLKVPYPILLVLAGLAIGFIPKMPHIGRLNPDVVFVLFLPPLIYYAGLMTSWRDFKSNLVPISLLAVGLVLFTTCAIAIVAHALITGLTWPAAFVLGAIVSPPDAVAATAILSRLRIPKGIITVLEGELLVNDATAIVAYRFAVAAAVTGVFWFWGAGLKFVIVAAGGVVVGYLAGRLVAFVRPRLRNEAVEGIVSLLTPYIAYLPAEALGVSGVLAAVTAGVYIGRRLPQITSSQTRVRLYAVWELVVFLMNGVIFILIGLQLPEIMKGLAGYRMGTLIGYALAVSLAAVIVRLVWVFPVSYLLRVLGERHGNRGFAPPWRHTFVVSWVALRGIVSLAAALALPLYTKTGAPFPGRDLILVITFGVILFSLVVQGLTLPLVIRALQLHGDDGEAREEALARLEAAHAALARLEVLGVTDEEAADLIARVRLPYQERVDYLAAVADTTNGERECPQCRSVEDVQRLALAAEREMLIRLRDDGLIGDEVLRRVQQDLDLAELKLAGAGNTPPQ